MPELTREQARRVYDRIGSLQDSQAFYEDRATERISRYGRFESAYRVVEFGCGTGRLAARLLSERLPEQAHYRALDLSPVMVDLARERLAPFGPRVEVALTDGSPPVSEPTASRDRFVSTFVLDVLPEDDIAAVVREAHRILEPGGMLCLASLSTGSGPLSRFVARVWSRLYAWRPALVGGCRPLDLLARIPDEHWQVVHEAKLTPFAVPLQVVVAQRR